ncbi:hypothetical protein ABBQ38_004280 [Trebouxia sp. C0009 RCD-2024]
MAKTDHQEPPAVWQSVGRGTPAGRALFNLFSDNVNGKQTGDKYSARNKAVHEAKTALGWRPSLPGAKASHGVPTKPAVCVPKFRKAVSAGSSVVAPCGKKSADIILKELAQRQLEVEQQRMPPPQGPLLDDVEKQRLAEWMRYKGKPPERKPSQALPYKPKPGSKADLQNLFDQIVSEVSERQQYLQDMAAYTSTRDHQAVSNQMKREIHDRVQEMNRLDELLRGARP